MSRRRWVMLDGALVEVTAAQCAQPHIDSGALWGDRHYTGIDPRFSTRTQHRAYLRERGLTTLDDFKEAWDRAARHRAEVFTTGRDPTRRGDVAQATAQVAAGYRPHVERSDGDQ